MRVHTNGFKTNIGSFGRIINTRIYHYLNYNLVSEDEDAIITEDNINLISEQIDSSNKELLDNSKCYSMSIVKNGQLLQSLMKEFDFESEYNLKVGEVLNPQLGVIVNNAFEYLDYGNYIIYSKKFNEESQRWNYVCYDKMLYSMIPYKPVNVTYPCTIRDYINALANRVGLTFTNASDTFTNYDQLIYKDLFENQGLTYRDVLDKLSEITASNILINDNDELEIGYPNSSGDTLNEDNLKDVNVTFGEKFGAISKVAILDTEGNYQYVKGTDGTQITIKDNILAFNGDTDTICQNLLDNLNGLYYYISDFKTTGICYYDFLDLFNVTIGDNTYQCLLLNNEINISSGIEETIYTDKLEESESETDKYTTSIMTNKQVQFIINQQKGEIQSRVEKDGVISAINQSAEEITINANKIKLEGYTTINNGFSVDEQGNMTANNATLQNATFVVNENNSGNTAFIDISTGNFYNNDIKTSISPAVIELTNDATDGGMAIEPQIRLNQDSLSFQTLLGASGCYSPSFTQTSKEKDKKNFEKYDNSALDTINSIDIYKYHLKGQDDSEKKHIGFVIGNSFKYSQEITSNNNDGVDIYSFVSLCCKAIQEQQEIINNLEKRIEKLEKECDK